MAIPTQRQLEWADMEVGVIIHCLMDVYNPDFTDIFSREVRTHMPPSIFDPKHLDTDQWIAAAKAAGARYAVLVANHCTGFSLWPTDVNDYSVKSSPWKDGKGDIVADFIASCKKYDIKPGLYYSTGANGYYGINDADCKLSPEEYRKYSINVERQLTELWTRYGELFEIWFDGGIMPLEKGGPDCAGLLERYQPNALCFQGPRSHAHNLRWVGNELGLAPENCWSATNRGEWAFDGTFDNEEAGVGDPDGRCWMPAETDMGNRRKDAFGGGWAWKAGEEDKVYTTDELIDCYCRSVGRNSNLLIGMAINSDGIFEDAAQFEAFGKRVSELFGNAKVSTEGEGGRISLKLPDDTCNYVVIREDISRGHSVRGFRLLLDGREIYKSQCIGHKRIVPVPGLSGNELTLEITNCAGDVVIKELSVC